MIDDMIRETRKVMNLLDRCNDQYNRDDHGHRKCNNYDCWDHDNCDHHDDLYEQHHPCPNQGNDRNPHFDHH